MMPNISSCHTIYVRCGARGVCVRVCSPFVALYKIGYPSGQHGISIECRCREIINAASAAIDDGIVDENQITVYLEANRFDAQRIFQWIPHSHATCRTRLTTHTVQYTAVERVDASKYDIFEVEPTEV